MNSNQSIYVKTTFLPPDLCGCEYRFTELKHQDGKSIAIFAPFQWVEFGIGCVNKCFWSCVMSFDNYLEELTPSTPEQFAFIQFLYHQEVSQLLRVGSVFSIISPSGKKENIDMELFLSLGLDQHAKEDLGWLPFMLCEVLEIKGD